MRTTTPSQFFADAGDVDAFPAAPAESTAPRRQRQGYTLVGAILAIFVGWGLTGVGAAPALGLAVRTEAGFAVLDENGTRVAWAPDGQLSPDGAVVVHAQARGTVQTHVVATDALTGDVRWTQDVPGQMDVRLVAEGGTAAVLGPRTVEGSGPYVPEGRARTTLVVASQAGHRQLDLVGNFEPEAMSRDNSSVFVIQYSPPLEPQSYQVRRLDLLTGKVVDVFTPDEELQQEMGGTARTQVASRDGRRLYTLYTLGTPDGSHSRAFVHVLDLDELWAHCIDLPAEFTGDGASTALAVSPDGGRLVVADRMAGRIATIDTKSLETLRTEKLGHGEELEPIAADMGSAGNVYVSAGSRVEIINATSLQSVGWLQIGDPVVAVHMKPRDELVVATADSILTIDSRSRERLAVQDWGDQPPIIGLGPAPAAVSVPKSIDCAC